MISGSTRVSQDRLLRLAQFGALLLASAVVIAFIRFHLVSSALSFRQDFERQSFIELSRGETFLVARKLAALGKAEQFSCISATKSGILFFEEKNGSCESSFLSVKEIVTEPNHQIVINFTIRLQPSLFWGLIFFLLAQAMMAVTIYFSQVRLNFLRMEGDLALAALAQQVAHDIQSPLSVLSSFKEGGAEWNREQRSLHKRAVHRLKQLVGHLQGDKGTAAQGSALTLILSQAAQEKQVEWKNKGAPDIQISWKESLGNRQLVGEEFEWRRIISNLLNNALEASAPGAPVTLEVSSGQNGRIVLSVIDKGKGMSPATLGKIGVRGFTHGKSRGNGLGFFLAKTYVASVGGDIEVSSKEGQGTTVKLAVPSVDCSAAILVDDDLDLALAWRLIGERRGIALQHYSTLEEFLAARAGIPKETQIFLDLEFPGGGASSMEVGELLGKEGFTRISIATGRPKSQVLKPGWALAVVGKDPPWL